ncbi:TPA: GPO family capsid scaffolding protein [Yersinia enterocolitica]|nr:GPO family capsid scaffolding protein [Yersinia enterocolitica]ELI8441100.1 GPO family capsid scaffolding protein [Yersinia enterocolitica]ELW8974551.1 GPO family capsid scaffolding protein [Yersinia enterocolitica]HDL6611444.1 GPO family capsid scaffolding protein [Yersinia enterocolitica]HDM8323412.1 GPO family capsid scaffolding protein [Yersinia enterocolitica]
MPKLSQFFRVAVEGAAADGRTINRQDLEDIALTYDPTFFGARVDLEHYKSLMPDSVFRCYGDVTAVKTEKIINGPLSGKLALLAQISPTDEMLTLNKSRQKVYTSIQFSPNFADSGRAYLKGLALTDNPGSLGTEMIQFCAQQVAAGKPHPLAGRKHSPDCLFTALEETFIEFEEVQAADDTSKKFTAKIKELLFGAEKKTDGNLDDIRQAVQLVAESQKTVLENQQQFAASQREITDLKSQLSQLSTSFAALTTQLQSEDNQHTSRPPAKGGPEGSADDTIDC